MKIYTVHRRYGGGDPDRNLVLVKEGFCWPAFFLGGIWALWHRMWLLGFVCIGVEVWLEALPALLPVDPTAHGIAMMGLHVLVGYLANDMRRWSLTHRRFDETAVVAGADLSAAETRYLEAAGRLGMGVT